MLDGESIPVLGEVCKRHWGEERKIVLSLEGVCSISGEGRDFLKEIKDKVDGLVKSLLKHHPGESRGPEHLEITGFRLSPE